VGSLVGVTTTGAFVIIPYFFCPVLAGNIPNMARVSLEGASAYGMSIGPNQF